MNAKTAKALRRKAREQTEGLPERRYLGHKETRQIINDPQTTRGYYRRMKKLYKAGVR